MIRQNEHRDKKVFILAFLHSAVRFARQYRNVSELWLVPLKMGTCSYLLVHLVPLAQAIGSRCVKGPSCERRRYPAYLLHTEAWLVPVARGEAQMSRADRSREDRSRSPTETDSLKISKAIAGFGRYPSKRPHGLHVDHLGCMKLDDIMRYWGFAQGLAEKDVMHAVRKHMFRETAEGGSLRFALDGQFLSCCCCCGTRVKDVSKSWLHYRCMMQGTLMGALSCELWAQFLATPSGCFTAFHMNLSLEKPRNTTRSCQARTSVTDLGSALSMWQLISANLHCQDLSGLCSANFQGRHRDRGRHHSLTDREYDGVLTRALPA
eukprot:Skav232483  [mRNA]  locus=scaffold2877:268415:272296:+ [translate_table: standard]